MQHTIAAVFDNRSSAQQAMDDLIASGFARDEMRLSEDGAGGPGSQTAAAGQVREEEGVGSGIKHFFRDLLGSDTSEHAQVYSEAVSRGHYVLTLNTSDESDVERASDIVERYNPIDIDEHAAQWRSAGWTGAEPPRTGSATQQTESMSQQQALQGGQTTTQSGMQQGTQQGTLQGAQQGTLQGSALQGSQQRAEVVSGETTAIPVIQEELKVGKREVQRGGVRVFQHVRETPVNESIGLREEHVRVERHPVDHPASTDDLAAFQETSFELRETAEEAVVEKTARVVEEVVVGKDVSQRQEQISDTLRRTEVEVEQIPAGTAATWSDEENYYRTHWSSNYAKAGTYDEYAPAYRYGSTMAGSEMYRGRPWDEIEPTLRTDWEARNPGSGWEKFKAAVRHGWDRITS